MEPAFPRTARVASHLHLAPKWWIRSDGEHTVDPNWERGMYIWCHERMRKAVSPGVAIVDVVWNGTATVIRSAWIVKDKSGENVLRFDRYYFVAPEKPPIVYRRGHFRSPPAGAKLEGGELRHLWQRVLDRYESLSVDARPKIIEPDDWRRMCETATERLGVRHKCH